MAYTGSDLSNRVRKILRDTDSTYYRWDPTEMLFWMNDAGREIVTIKPDANAVVEIVQLTSGIYQTLPTRATMLMDVMCSVGTDGLTRGTSVTVVEREYMDRIKPNWRVATASSVVEHVIYDSLRMPKAFWVYPKSDGTNYLEIVTSKIPTEMTGISEVLPLGDEYLNAYVQYVLAMCYSKDVEDNYSVQKAEMHMQMFYKMIGVREMNEKRITPYTRSDQ